MCNMEHADEDKDEGSTHAILISDLRETKPQGEREALEKATVRKLSSTTLSTCTAKDECEI